MPKEMRPKAARVSECATGQTRTTTRPCGSADAIGIDVGMTRWRARGFDDEREGLANICIALDE